MRHTIILWDCCYRNFFHLTGSLADQDYPRDDYEILWVEQRSRAASDRFNHRLGLRSLGDTVAALADRCQVRVVYLDQPPAHPYHIGVCVNAGAALARGEILSRMDGDMLVQPDFLTSLDRAHEQFACVLNLAKRRAVRAVGVPEERWAEGVIDFDRCLAECPRGAEPVPETVTNKGPLISAPRAWWTAIEGYDEHDLWSTGISRNGQDVTARMEILSGRPSRTVPDQVGVHPYHPQGLDRQGPAEVAIFAAQARLIAWSRERGEPKLGPRAAELAAEYAACREAVDDNLRALAAREPECAGLGNADA